MPAFPRTLKIWLMLAEVVLFAGGVSAWTFAEYAIHGWLGHRFRTFATPLHSAHHRDPHAVFTVGAWIPVAIVTIAAVCIIGKSPEVYALGGMAFGFAAYETIHYRIHFVRPANRIESHLRARHLTHHLRAPDAIFGVTNSIWDRAFGTEPEWEELERLERDGAACPALSGSSNWRLAFRPWTVWRRID